MLCEGNCAWWNVYKIQCKRAGMRCRCSPWRHSSTWRTWEIHQTSGISTERSWATCLNPTRRLRIVVAVPARITTFRMWAAHHPTTTSTTARASPASRCGSQGYWLSWLKRKMKVKEMWALQGLPKRSFPKGVLMDNQLGQIIGNAIPVTLLAKVMSSLFEACPLRWDLCCAIVKVKRCETRLWNSQPFLLLTQHAKAFEFFKLDLARFSLVRRAAGCLNHRTLCSFRSNLAMVG